MQLAFLAGLAAVAVGVSAQTSVSPEQAKSVLLVLATALPSDVRDYAIASESAFAAEMSSSLSAGNTPGWYASMPADVKSILPLLYPVAAEASTTPVVTSTATSASAVPTGLNSTSISAVHSATLSANGTRTGTITGTATGSPLPESTGAASHARAAVGASLAGVAGFLAMLAL
ncbi:hypothetical protein N0V95_003997 [Ascochyta clinopodiicola]|nr:hypothetical protein N0V95_003997 [Ascochyta clinopodiicola]